MFKGFRRWAEKLRTAIKLPKVRKKGFVSRLFHRKDPLISQLPQVEEVTLPAMEALTDALKAEVVGEGGIIDREFQKMIKEYDPTVNPIGRKEAEVLINSLLRKAISHRKLLNARIARSIECGQLFDQYYDRVHVVSALAVDAHTKMQRMDVAKENLDYHFNMLIDVRNNSYIEIPEIDSEEWGKLPKRDRDILKAIDEASGGV